MSVGGYRITDRLGQGGMGVVYRAESTSSVRRTVALKVMRKLLADDRSVLRFEDERRVLAKLSHPNIAQIYDAGTADDGSLYFAMELIEGSQLLSHCDKAKMSLEQRLRLFVQACRAVHYAHQKGVLHRDIKPGNIMLHEAGGDPVVKLIDFGIAKTIDGPKWGSDGLTGTGVIGTPGYMAPESFDPSKDLDTRSDIYALGMVLYELITGRNPLSDLSLAQVAQVSKTQPVPEPAEAFRGLEATAQTQVSTHRRTSPQSLVQSLKGDLGAILAKATERTREERYSSVEQLVADIERYLKGYPVEARPLTSLYRVSKFVQRNRLAVSAAAITLIGVLGGATWATLEARRATRAARRANQEAIVSAQITDFLLNTFKVNDPSQSRGRSVTAKEVLDRAAARLMNSDDDSALFSRFGLAIGTVYRQLGLYDESRTMLERVLEAESSARALVEYGKLATVAELPPGRAQRGFEEALALLKKQTGANSIESLRATTHAAIFHAAQTDYERASTLAREASEGLNTHHPTRLNERALAQATLGAALSATEDEAAVELLEGALQLARSAANPDLTLVSDILSDLSVDRARRGDTAVAIRWASELLDVDRQLFGENHSFVAKDAHNLAMMLYLADRVDEALPYLNQAIVIQSRAAGPASPLLGEMRKDLGLVLLTQGRNLQARKELQNGVAILERALGRKHLRTAIARMGLVELHRGSGRFSDAMAELRSVINVFESELESNNPRLLDALNTLELLEELSD